MGIGGSMPLAETEETSTPISKVLERIITIDGIKYKQTFTEDGTILNQVVVV